MVVQGQIVQHLIDHESTEGRKPIGGFRAEEGHGFLLFWKEKSAGCCAEKSFQGSKRRSRETTQEALAVVQVEGGGAFRRGDWFRDLLELGMRHKKKKVGKQMQGFRPGQLGERCCQFQDDECSGKAGLGG